MRKSILIIVGLLIFTIIVINVFFKNPTFNTPLETLDYALKSKQYRLAESVYLELIKADSNNLDLYYGHINNHFRIPERTKDIDSDEHVRDDEQIFDFYKKKSKSGIPYQKDVGFYGMGLFYSVQDNYKHALENFNFVGDKSLKYLNNSIGSVLKETGKYDSAEYYLLKEIEYNGNLDGAYYNLTNLYMQTNQIEKLDTLVARSSTRFSTYFLKDYYFKKAYYGKYLLQLVISGYENTDTKSAIAAFFIMLVWLFYLRRIDLFEPEKWKYIIYTFLLGILFSYSAFILYDILQHKLRFSLNGNIINDFIYCIVGVGLIEEFVKLVPFLIVLFFTREVNEPIDYIIYPSISALGFAFAENISYFHGIGFDIIHGRALISVVIHMFCSSIIGYGLYFGIKRFNLNKAGRIVIFLFFAGFVHGLFDFWLINEKARIFSVLSFLIILFSIIAWNTFINNALNFSIPEDSAINKYDHKKLQDYLIYGLSGVLIFEYIIVSISYGPEVGNSGLISAIQSGAFLLVFLTMTLSSFKIKKGYKSRIKLFNRNNVKYDEIVGQRIELIKYLYDKHSILPLAGQIIARETIKREKNWYLVMLENPMEKFDICHAYIIIKAKKRGGGIEKGLITVVGIYFIKNDGVLVKNKKEKNDLLFVDWFVVKA
jgi:protease PrsW